MSLLTIDGLSKYLETPQNLVIIPHQNPDGDALGSCLGWAHLMKKLGHTTTVCSPNAFPDFLSWMPGAKEILLADQNLEDCKKAIDSASLICTLDFNHLSRCGVLVEFIENSSAPILMVDHHISPSDYAKYTFSDTSMSSTCEMIYHLAKHLNRTDHIDSAIANCLYAGIVTDTGNFKYPSASATTLLIAADLLDKGADKTKINALLFEQSELSRFKLMGRCLNSLTYLEAYHSVYMIITEEDKKSCGFKRGDTEGFVNFGLSLRGCCFSVIFIENAEDSSIKMSFRSTGNFDVNEFARAHFNGGGHQNAAGGKSFASLSETIDLFTSLLPNYIESLTFNTLPNEI